MTGSELASHKVVMQVSDVDAAEQFTIIGQIKNILTALPDCKIEIITNGKGVELLLEDSCNVLDYIQELHKKRSVRFSACFNTLNRLGLDNVKLISEATVVPSALAEIILLQEKGYSYVKGGS